MSQEIPIPIHWLPPCEWIDTRLEDMFTAPPMWGGLEAFEFQVITLLECRAYLQGWQGHFLENYFRFLGFNQYLHVRCDEAQMVATLKLFHAHVKTL